MAYKMFLDDERDLASHMVDDPDWIVVRSYSSAVEVFEKHGCPCYISFDHDLGGGKTGFNVAQWIVDCDLDSRGNFIPYDFDFTLHSQNPVGRNNIKMLLDGYLMFRKRRFHPA